MSPGSTLTPRSDPWSIGEELSPSGTISIHRKGFRWLRTYLRPERSTLPAGSARARGYTRAVSKVCHVCGRAPAFGHSRSHSMVATKRRFNPNLQRVRINDGGTPRRVYVCTRCLKAGKVVKAP